MPGSSLVSVLVPAYNHERYVSDCLASIVAQTHPDLELIIANDGSTDDTHQAIDAFLHQHASRFARVVYLNRPNRGIAATLNELLSQARGRFLFLIASDDRAKPQAVSTLYSVLARRPRVALAVGDGVAGTVGVACGRRNHVPATTANTAAAARSTIGQRRVVVGALVVFMAISSQRSDGLTCSARCARAARSSFSRARWTS